MIYLVELVDVRQEIMEVMMEVDMEVDMVVGMEVEMEIEMEVEMVVEMVPDKILVHLPHHPPEVPMEDAHPAIKVVPVELQTKEFEVRYGSRSEKLSLHSWFISHHNFTTGWFCN